MWFISVPLLMLILLVVGMLIDLLVGSFAAVARGVTRRLL